jgi:hypothetical protein
MCSRWRRSIAALISIVVGPTLVLAYELQTHAAISLHAANASLLASYIATELLLDPNRGLDRGAISRPDVNPDGTASSWIEEGSVREDDYLPFLPPPIWLRSANHFYNPLPDAPNDGGYLYVSRVLGLLQGLPSPTWGLKDTMDAPLQQYSLKDARIHFYNALISSGSDDRDAELALTFRTLGQVIHLVQDMAQPQHTRNDSHGWAWLDLGGSSAFEKYTDDNDVRPNLPFGGYEPVYAPTDLITFNRPRSFWATGDGKGLAEYTNRGFVSAVSELRGHIWNIDIRHDPTRASACKRRYQRARRSPPQSGSGVRPGI